MATTVLHTHPNSRNSCARSLSVSMDAVSLEAVSNESVIGLMSLTLVPVAP